MTWFLTSLKRRGISPSDGQGADNGQAKFLKGLRRARCGETIVPEIEGKPKAVRAVWSLTGVGLVYPYLRTHSILSNLQRLFKEFPW